MAALPVLVIAVKLRPALAAVGPLLPEIGADGPGTIAVKDAVERLDGGVLAVDHVSLEVATLLRPMAGLIPLTDGSIDVNGPPVPGPDRVLDYLRLLPGCT